MKSRFARLLFVLGFLMAAPAALAVDARLLLPGGAPAVGATVSIPGHPGSLRSDRNGRFTLPGGTSLPLTLIVVDASGDIYPPVTLAELPAGDVIDITLQAVVRESITVTSGVAPNIEAPPAAGTTLLGREDLEERRPEHVVDAVARTAGVAVRGEGPAAVPVIRGLAGGRTLILFDDARITAERRAGPSATFLDPFSLASIEISRGPGSVAYGSDAFGGVIHARPRDPVAGQTALLYDLSTTFDGREQKSAGVEWAGDVPAGSLLASLHARQGDDGQSGDGTPIPNSAYESRGGALRFLAPVQTGLFRVALTVNHARDTGAPAADALVNPTYYPKEDSNLLTLSWDGSGGSLFDALAARVSVGSYHIITNRERLPNATTTRQISSADVDADDASFRFTATKMTSRGRLHSGLDVVSRFNLHATGFVEAFTLDDAPTTRTSEVSIDDASKINGGLFVIYDHALSDRLSLSGGLRADRIQVENRGGFFGDQSRDDTALSGHLGVSYVPTPSLTATLQVARGYREPTLSDRYFRGVSGRGFVVGNPNLEPERSIQYDAALRWQRAGRSIALLAYRYNIEDLVERFRAGTDFNFRNRGEAELHGAELEVSAPVGFGFSVVAAAAIARGEVLDDDAPLDDIAAPNGHLALRWANSRASAFINASAWAEDDRPGPVETRRPGYATIDVGGSWAVLPQAELRLAVRNLADRTYAGSPDANAALAPGRNVTVALGGRF